MKTRKNKTFKILSLDGGGSKGAYTLGALQAIESLFDNGPLINNFDLIYGTSTGAIISSLININMPIEKIYEEYKKVIPVAFSSTDPNIRSQKLREQAERIFKDKSFLNFEKPSGIVATNTTHENPLIFKSHLCQIHNGKSSFIPGLGFAIEDALMASAAAIPFLTEQSLCNELKGKFTAIDGGFIANNPSLFAITDAIGPMKVKQKDTVLCSIGTGIFNESEIPMPFHKRFIGKAAKYTREGKFIPRALSANSASIEQVVEFCFAEIDIFRLNGTHIDIQTNFLETNLDTIDKMFHAGKRDFLKEERRFKKMVF